ncbi:tetratricopeptide repeat protein [Verrucomicrobiales bacterium]|nr:tetratricopeptide repeat protein [Verrucomicrobiales bacterium]
MIHFIASGDDQQGMGSEQEIIKKATGYCELGMFSDAWDLIESLPPEEKTKAPVLDLRLRILTAFSQWELGEHIAELLLYAGESESHTVARFHHSRARAFYEIGEYQKARECFKRAVGAWDGIRKELIDDDLSALFL